MEKKILNIKECRPDESLLSKYPLLKTLTISIAEFKYLRQVIGKNLDGHSDKLQDLLSRLLCFDPEKRPTAAECLMDAYFADFSPSLHSHRTCAPLSPELVDSEIQKFVDSDCGGV